MTGANYQLMAGDCLEVMKTFYPNIFDTIITDSPYGLSFMGKNWDHGVPGVPFWAEMLRVAKPGAMLLAFGGTRTHHRLMVAIEDAGWEIRDVVMFLHGSGFPKGHNIHENMVAKTCQCKGSAVSYSHNEIYTEPDTQHNMRPLRQGDLPQTINASDKCGQVLQSVLPQQDSQSDGQESSEGIEGREESSLEGWSNVLQEEGELQEHPVCESAGMVETDGAPRRVYHGTPLGDGKADRPIVEQNGSSASRQPQSGRQHSNEFGTLAQQQCPQESRMGQTCPRCGKPLVSSEVLESWRGWNTALKPAWEPIIVAMKPLDGTYAQNALAHGVAGLNIDGCRIEGEFKSGWSDAPGRKSKGGILNITDEIRDVKPDNPAGRWPANLVLDESAAALLDEQSGETKSTGGQASLGAFRNGDVYGKGKDIREKRDPGYGDQGGISRYFTVLPDSEPRFYYTAKASTSERNEGLDYIEAHQRDASRNADQPSMNGGEGNPYNRGAAPVRNSHPTVKPLSLMRWLVRLTRTPKGGLVLDPFAGSGTTGVACLLERRSCVLIEREPEYAEIARHRLEHWQDEAEMASIKIKGKDSDYANSPLFAGVV